MKRASSVRSRACSARPRRACATRASYWCCIIRTRLRWPLRMRRMPEVWIGWNHRHESRTSHSIAGHPFFYCIQSGIRFYSESAAVRQWPGAPDFVALVLLFWDIHQPRKVGIGIAFALGLLMDVHDASLLGEHALAYTLLSYGAIMIHRRVLWF